MSIKENVFGSGSERLIYKALREKWGKSFNLYHNLPFLNVFSCKDKEFMDFAKGYAICKISTEQFQQLKSLSIDFVFCDKTDKPVLCIEFDGLQDGFNIGSSYQSNKDKGSRKSRKDLLDLKLKIAHGFGMPFFVMSSAHFKSLSNVANIAIVDAVIGEIFANDYRTIRLNSFNTKQLGYSEAEFAELSQIEQDSLIENWLLEVEVSADYEKNPVFKEVARLSKELNVTSCSFGYLNSDNEEDRALWSQVSCEISTAYGSAQAEFKMPNFNSPGMCVSAHLAQGISELLALSLIKSGKKKNKILNK